MTGSLLPAFVGGVPSGTGSLVPLVLAILLLAGVAAGTRWYLKRQSPAEPPSESSARDRR